MSLSSQRLHSLSESWAGLDIALGCSRNERPMNTNSSGSGGVDDIKGHPQGEIRGATKLVKSLKRLFSAAPEGTAALFLRRREAAARRW